MTNITLENFISFCDEMTIAEEGFFNKKENLFLNSFFNTNNIASDELDKANKVISDIKSKWITYEKLITDAINKYLKTNQKPVKYKVMHKLKSGIVVKIADNDGEFSFKLKDGSTSSLKYKAGDVLTAFHVISSGILKESYGASISFVNSNMMNPMYVFKCK